jgi:flavin-binding protein dodecin
MIKFIAPVKENGHGSRHLTCIWCISILITIERRRPMAGKTYKIIDLVGTSEKSWEDAAKRAVETAGETLRELRIAEVSKLDMVITSGKVTAYRSRVTLSFKVIR